MMDAMHWLSAEFDVYGGRRRWSRRMALRRRTLFAVGARVVLRAPGRPAVRGVVTEILPAKLGKHPVYGVRCEVEPFQRQAREEHLSLDPSKLLA